MLSIRFLSKKWNCDLLVTLRVEQFVSCDEGHDDQGDIAEVRDGAA